MLSRLTNIFAGTIGPSYPSVVLILEAVSTTSYVLHIVPEDGAKERVDYTSSKGVTFRYIRAKERSREQLGAVLLHVGSGETPSRFLDEIATRVTQLLSQREKPRTGESGAHALDQALRSAALDSLLKRENQEPPVNAAQLYKIFVVQVDRSKPGKIMTDYEPTSISRW